MPTLLDVCVADMTTSPYPIPLLDPPPRTWAVKPSNHSGHRNRGDGIAVWYPINPGSPIKNADYRWRVLQAWFVLFRAVGDDPYARVWVQLAEYEVWIRRASTGQWFLGPTSSGWYASAYSSNLQGNPTGAAQKRNESAGNLEIRMGLPPANVIHGSRSNFRVDSYVDDINGIMVRLRARLVPESSSVPDERSRTRILVHVGADWYPESIGLSQFMPAADYVPGMGTSMFKPLAADWQWFHYASIYDPGNLGLPEVQNAPAPLSARFMTIAQFRANPPSVLLADAGNVGAPGPTPPPAPPPPAPPPPPPPTGRPATSAIAAYIVQNASVAVPADFLGIHRSVNVPAWRPNGGAAVPAPTYPHQYVRTLKAEANGQEEVCFWRNIERTAGVYTWTDVDAWMTATAPRKIIWTVYGTPPFYGQFPTEPSRWPSWPGAASPLTAAGITALRNFVTALLARHGSRIAALEVWNEPTLPWTSPATTYTDRWSPAWGQANGQTLAPFFAGTATDLANIAWAVQSVAGATPVLGCGFVDQWQPDAVTVAKFANAPVTAAGGSGTGKTHIDAWSIHFYDYDYQPNQLRAVIDGYAARFAAVGSGALPVWLTEVGAEQGGRYTSVGDDRAVTMIRRTALIAAAKGLRSAVYYGHINPQEALPFLGDPANAPNVSAALGFMAALAGRTIKDAAVLTDGDIFVEFSNGQMVYASGGAIALPTGSPTPGPAPAPPPAGTYTVVALGDSSVAGNEQTFYSFRGQLSANMTANGYAINYLGPNSSASNGAADPEHAGYIDATIGPDSGGNNIDARVASIFGTVPNAIVLSVGVRDTWENQDDIGAKYQALVTKLLALNASVRVVCVVPPPATWMSPGEITRLGALRNAAVAAAANARVWTVDAGTVVGAGDLVADGLHYSLQGATAVAALIGPALRAAINSIAGAPAPGPAPPPVSDGIPVPDTDRWASLGDGYSWGRLLGEPPVDSLVARIEVTPSSGSIAVPTGSAPIVLGFRALDAAGAPLAGVDVDALAGGTRALVSGGAVLLLTDVAAITDAAGSVQATLGVVEPGTATVTVSIAGRAATVSIQITAAPTPPPAGGASAWAKSIIRPS